MCDARIVIERGRLVETAGNIQMKVSQPTASRASGRR
jgi:hypothetical protein